MLVKTGMLKLVYKTVYSGVKRVVIAHIAENG